MVVGGVQRDHDYAGSSTPRSAPTPGSASGGWGKASSRDGSLSPRRGGGS